MFRDLSLSESLNWGFEPGYIILNKVIGYFTADPQIFLAVLSILILIPICCMIWKRSVNPILSLLVFVAVGNLFSSYAALRQWCAVAVMVLSYDYIIRRKPIRFFITIAAACLFHQTALFFIPLYFVYPLRVTRQKLLLGIALALGILVFAEPLMMLLARLARNETRYIQDGGYVKLITCWVLVLLIDFFASPIENEKYMKLNYWALLYSAVIQPMCLVYSGFARIQLYTWFAMVLCIPGLIQYMSRDYDWRNAFLMKAVVSFIMIVWFLVTEDTRGITLIFLAN